MIYTLSVVGVARTLVWIIAIYFIVKILSRLLTPFLMKYAAKKMEQRFGQQFNTQQPQKKAKRLSIKCHQTQTIQIKKLENISITKKLINFQHNSFNLFSCRYT